MAKNKPKDKLKKALKEYGFGVIEYYAIIAFIREHPEVVKRFIDECCS